MPELKCIYWQIENGDKYRTSDDNANMQTILASVLSREGAITKLTCIHLNRHSLDVDTKEFGLWS